MNKLSKKRLRRIATVGALMYIAGLLTLIEMDTPETVQPTKAVQHGGGIR